MKKSVAIISLVASTIFAGNFSTTNIQYLYSDHFKGNAYAYDTSDGVKQTVTLEHFRTFDYGDLFFFVDAVKGKQMSGDKESLYSEIDPRISLSKISGKNLSAGILKDVFVATQYNAGHNYQAWLKGVGADFDVPGFAVFSVNVYDKIQNAGTQHLTQYTPVYISKEFYGFHLDGFQDITDEDFSTQNQILYNVGKHFGGEKIYAGFEHLHYRNWRTKEHTDALQAMVKYQW